MAMSSWRTGSSVSIAQTLTETVQQAMIAAGRHFSRTKCEDELHDLNECPEGSVGWSRNSGFCSPHWSIHRKTLDCWTSGGDLRV